MQRLSTIRNPRDISIEHTEFLNICLIRDVEFSNLLPCSSTDSGKSSNSTASSTKSTPLHIDRLNKIKDELLFRNDDAFREVLRLPPLKDRGRVRVAQARKFWTGLEHMSQYWDTSLDEYLEVPDSALPEYAPTVPGTDVRISPATNEDIAMVDAGQTHPEQKMKRVYRGRRIGTGKDMPEDYRDETLRGLMEAVAWSFNCQVTSPSQQPRVSVGKILVPVKQNLIVGRPPKDRQEARKGMLEGPLMGAFGRGHAGYGPDAHKDASQAEVCDLLREVGAMVELAQQRAREGKSEKSGQDHAWWTAKPRWGGGPGGPMGWEDELQKKNSSEPAPKKKRPLSEAEMDKIMEELDEADLVPSHIRPKAEQSSPKETGERGNGRSRGGSGGNSAKRWSNMAEKWKTVKPGASLWDSKIKYMRIGQMRKAEASVLGESLADTSFDDIFMVSSINHHVSVLRLRISDEYLAWLAEEQVKTHHGARQQESDANILKLWRTKWYDLFVPEERVELVEGLWMIMTWLLRDDEEDRKKQSL